MSEKYKYDVQQVCENGHQITGCYHFAKDERQEFCKKCGVSTMFACPSCSYEIQGDKLEDDWGGWHCVKSATVPSYCSNCGNPYPWTTNKIMAAIQVFVELGTDEDIIKEDMHNIAKDIPQAKPSAIRIKRICEKYGPVAYNVVMELTSRTAAEIFKGNIQ